MENEPADKQASGGSGSRADYTSFPKHSYNPLFDAALTAIGVPLTPKSIERFFAGKVDYWQVVNWRRGRGLPSQAAWTALAVALESRATNLLSFAVQSRSAPYAPGTGSARAICRYNAIHGHGPGRRKRPSVDPQTVDQAARPTKSQFSHSITNT